MNGHQLTDFGPHFNCGNEGNSGQGHRLLDFGPRFVEVTRAGNEVSHTHLCAQSGTLKPISVNLGRVGPIPFDSTVRNVLGRSVGTLSTFGDKTFLQRW